MKLSDVTQRRQQNKFPLSQVDRKSLKNMQSVLGLKRRPFFRWWMHLRQSERIVTMALLVGGTVAVINSTAWAIAVSYMARQKTKGRQVAITPEEAAALVEQMEADREGLLAAR
jgi:hypothetical protein